MTVRLSVGTDPFLIEQTIAGKTAVCPAAIAATIKPTYSLGKMLQLFFDTENIQQGANYFETN